MSTLTLVLLFIAVIATGTFYVAGDLSVHGSRWAMDVCHSAGTLCDHPLWGAIASAAIAALYAVLRLADL
jgi:hypothetical protein